MGGPGGVIGPRGVPGGKLPGPGGVITLGSGLGIGPPGGRLGGPGGVIGGPSLGFFHPGAGPFGGRLPGPGGLNGGPYLGAVGGAPEPGPWDTTLLVGFLGTGGMNGFVGILICPY